MAKFKTRDEALNYLKTGKKVKILKTINSGWFKAGDTFSAAPGQAIGYQPYINGNNILIYSGTGASLNILMSDIEPYAETVEELEVELANLNKEVAYVQDKIAYLKETKQTEFDLNEFKVWRTLQLLNKPKMSDLEKAKAIASLISGT